MSPPSTSGYLPIASPRKRVFARDSPPGLSRDGGPITGHGTARGGRCRRRWPRISWFRKIACLDHFASMLSDVMNFYSESSTRRTRESTRRRTRVLFVVSRDRPDRYESLVHAFSSDADVKVIFDRRRVDRRQHDRTPMADRRRRDRRSDVRNWAVRSMGWVRVDC